MSEVEKGGLAQEPVRFWDHSIIKATVVCINTKWQGKENSGELIYLIVIDELRISHQRGRKSKEDRQREAVIDPALRESEVSCFSWKGKVINWRL